MKAKKIQLRRLFFSLGRMLTVFVLLVLLYLLYDYFPGQFFHLAGIIFLIILGFELPVWVGRNTRLRRAFRYKTREKQKWGFHSRDREGPWINYIDFPLVKMTDLAKGRAFYSEWLIIHDGMIIVNPGQSDVDLSNKTVKYDFSKTRTYAWDGCSPKLSFLWLLIVGTPDWWQKSETIKKLSTQTKNPIQDKRAFWPLMHHASLVHDALYQYLHVIPLSKKEVDKLFYRMLRENNVFWLVAAIYYIFVRIGGGGDVGSKKPEANSNLDPGPLPSEQSSVA